MIRCDDVCCVVWAMFRLLQSVCCSQLTNAKPQHRMTTTSIPFSSLSVSPSRHLSPSLSHHILHPTPNTKSRDIALPFIKKLRRSGETTRVKSPEAFHGNSAQRILTKIAWIPQGTSASCPWIPKTLVPGSNSVSGQFRPLDILIHDADNSVIGAGKARGIRGFRDVQQISGSGSWI